MGKCKHTERGVADAIRAVHALGFDVLSRVELLLDPRDRWRPGERIAVRPFRV